MSLKLSSYAIHGEPNQAISHITAIFDFPNIGANLDEIVATVSSCAVPRPVSRTEEDAIKFQEEIKNLQGELLLRAQSHGRTSEELKKALKDLANSEHALQEIQGTYTKLASASKDLRLHNERLQHELNTAQTEIQDLRAAANGVRMEVTYAAPNGPVGEDPKTGEYVYEGVPVVPAAPSFIHDPVDEDPEEADANETPLELFRKAYTLECANIKGTSQTDVIEQALTVYNANKAAAVSFGVQREFGNALRLAIADCLKIETDIAGALFSAKLEAIKGKAADAAKAELTPALVSKFNDALDLPLVKAKNSPRQKIVGALAVACSDAGKVKLADMVAAAGILKPLVMEEKDWKALLEKGSNGKTQLEILSKIVAQGLDLTLV